MTLLNGNQTMILMTAFLLENGKREKSMETNLLINDCFQSDDGTSQTTIECKVGLTGFKWIAKMIKDSRAGIHWWW
jgi:phosphomannomutase